MNQFDSIQAATPSIIFKETKMQSVMGATTAVTAANFQKSTNEGSNKIQASTIGGQSITMPNNSIIS